MIPVEPYSAERQIFTTTDDGGLRSEWQPCRVVGIAMKDDEPAYIIETYSGTERTLDVEGYVRVDPYHPRRPSA